MDESLAEWLRGASRLPGEDALAYAELEAAVRGSLNPKDGLAELWVADIAALSWEILRLQRMRIGLIIAHEGDGVAEIFRIFHLEDGPDTAIAWARNDGRGDRAAILAYVADVRLGRDAFLTQTAAGLLPQLEAMDRLIESLRIRRRSYLEWLEDRNAAAVRANEALKGRRLGFGAPTAV